MFQIDVKSRKPIYEQIVDYFKELIISGAMKKDEKAPSVRELAKELTINPNTIQKAYRELENRGFFYSITGVGSFVSGQHEEEIRPSKISEMRRTFMTALKELLYYGYPHEEIFVMIEECGLALPGRKNKPGGEPDLRNFPGNNGSKGEAETRNSARNNGSKGESDPRNFPGNNGSKGEPDLRNFPGNNGSKGEAETRNNARNNTPSSKAQVSGNQSTDTSKAKQPDEGRGER